VAHSSRKSWNLAVQDYDQALKLEPGLAAALYGRGVAKDQMGDKVGADEDISAARKIDPDIGK